MAKKLYVCKNCGAQFGKWYGRCPNCGEWGTIEEIAEGSKSKEATKVLKPVRLSEIDTGKDIVKLGGEFSGFFSKEIPKGGVYLISGTPGIGKSTLLLQLAHDLFKSGSRVVYISAEESLGQIAERAKRLKVEEIEAISESKLEDMLSFLEFEKLDCAIIDSIHTIFSDEIDYVPGGIQQVKYCAEKLIDVAKSRGIVLFIVAHITKSGAIAGPKTLEHMVDAVLLMEGDKNTNLRIVKFTKNRFGSTDEALILEMTKDGLKRVEDPTLKFLEKREFTDGICYGATIEGTYPIILEVQALCVETPLAIPRRVSVGFDINRLNMLLAVLEKKLGLPFFKYDVYVNITGGIRASSTAIDAAVVSAIISSIKKSALKEDTVAFSEVDLTGRLRLFEREKRIVKKLEDLGFNVISALDVKDVKQLYESI